MADTSSSGIEEKYAFCLSYLNTKNCARGGYCRYEHANASDVQVTVKPSGTTEFVLGYYITRKRKMECRFYARGNCRNGASCRFLHQNPMTADTRETASVDNSWLNKYSSQPSASTSGSKTSNSSTDNVSNSPVNMGFVSNNDQEETMEDLEKRKENWVHAPEFVPKANQKPKSYAEVVNANNRMEINPEDRQLCVFLEKEGVCKYPLDECPYIHGDICDFCETAALHPFNEEQRKRHRQECVAQHEKDMELSFAIARSKNKACGVCFETIMEKTDNEQRFGILPNCNHCFCLACIRKWRKARQFDNRIIRACPECRVTSDFVCPSMYWVETKEEKDKLIDNYKKALSEKDCKYFRKGNGRCPFGNKCFYLHALPDGTKTDVGPPRRRVENVSFSMLQEIILWDFLDERENRWLYSLADDLEDLVAFFSDSDDTDWSDSDVFLE
ncbi:probable E3 ubiquitin-protein ligase makorin-1 isoform X2 [Agrilus planipennis]|uniref:RING-type E3 ubiquitin transferase n=1 Tax=Agrilus planipennis TaxID=224129 RepID=A0A1W4WRG7_AGRPL|nr:probable E3 ubiquitin-protein ligase makorin-1 isoform X2 [Agrilus planipennis]